MLAIHSDTSVWSPAMPFPENLVNHRKRAGLTQKALAAQIGMSLVQVKNYEAGRCQPTLDVIRRLAMTFGTTTDALVFDSLDQGDSPNNKLQSQFAAISHYPQHEQDVVSTLLDAFIKKHRLEEMMKT